MPHLLPWALVALLAAALVPAAASAAEPMAEEHGYYASFSGLYVSPTESDLSYTEADLTISSDLKMDGDFGALVAIGYGASLGPRAEVEFGYRKLDFDKLDGGKLTGNGVSVSVEGELPFKGDITTLSLMLNGVYAFEAGPMRPYIGAGVGLARHDVSGDTQTATIGGVKFSIEGASEDDIVFAYQAMVGVGYEVSETTEVRLGYRYFASGDGDFEGLKASYGTHNFEGGILVRF